MRIHDDPPMHLTYCLNVHPGETWAENHAAIRDHAMRVRDRVCGGGRPFGLGMRLGAAAAAELASANALDEFRAFLHDNNLYVFTINGFPYGRFHGTSVKQDVYAPDWRTPERRDYTLMLADILAALLPEGVSGSISTVPGSYGRWIAGRADVEAMVTMLAETARHLAGIRDRTGRDICLALEPEPDCFLETGDDAIALLTGPLGQTARTAEDEELLRRHVGVCYDTAHAAVAFEDPAAALERMARAHVRVGKVHLSSAMRLTPTPEALKQLEGFCDDVYLHQVKVRAEGRIVSVSDLPDALNNATPQCLRSATPQCLRSAKPQAAQRLAPLAASQSNTLAASHSEDTEWRVHFHVPLFFESFGHIRSTSSSLTGAFPAAIAAAGVEHVEIETYTFGVLPAELRPADIADGITAEYEWVLDRMFRSSST